MENETEERFEDWRGREAIHGKHGGIRAAFIACVVGMMEVMVFISLGGNLERYLMKSMHYSSAKAANMVTNFLGTSYLLALFGGFVADSFLTRPITFISFCSIELTGLILLAFQAHNPNLQPEGDNTPSILQSTVLFTGLYAIALGTGGIKGSLVAHGGDQLDSRNERLISRFFNWYYFCVCVGWFMAITVMVWIGDNKGWNWSFDISVLVLAIALCGFVVGLPIYRFKRPEGSSLMKIVKVVVSAVRNRNGFGLDDEMMQNLVSNEHNRIRRNNFKFLDKALLNKNITPRDVEETRTFMSFLPIFGSTIIMNCCLAQLLTFSVQQGIAMNRKLTPSLQVPVPSLQAIPLIFILSSIPLYELFSQRISTNRSSSFSLKRIGLGLALSSISMAAAAIVEAKRKHEAVQNDFKISVFWLLFQYVLLCFSDVLILGGLLEFFYREAPSDMRSISTALGWSSTAMGLFLSSVLVTVTNAVTGWLGEPWLGGEDINKSRLQLFYVVLCVLNGFNIVNYVYWAKRY